MSLGNYDLLYGFIRLINKVDLSQNPFALHGVYKNPSSYNINNHFVLFLLPQRDEINCFVIIHENKV